MMNEEEGAPGEMAHAMIKKIIAAHYNGGCWAISVDYESAHTFDLRMKICGDACSELFKLRYEAWFLREEDGKYNPQYILITEKGGNKKSDQQKCWHVTPAQGGFELFPISPEALRFEELLSKEPPT